jgi:hypothetical protein
VTFDKIEYLAPGQVRPANHGHVPAVSANNVDKGFNGYEYWSRYANSESWPERSRWAELSAEEARYHIAKLRGGGAA